MNRNVITALIFSFSSALWAQTPPITTIRIGSDTIPWARFIVDGQQFQGMNTFTWPQGSKHTVQVATDVVGVPQNCPANLYSAIQQTQDRTTAILFSSWIDNTGKLLPTSSRVQTVTADPAITSFTATFTLEYRVILNLFDGAVGDPLYCQPANTAAPPPPPPDQVRPGVAVIDGVSYWNSAILYLSAGSHIINAFPYPGFVFNGWGLNAAAATPYLTTIDIEGPSQIVPYFVSAKRVRFLTNPMGLHVLVDRTPAQTTPILNTGTVDTCPTVYTRLPLPPVGILPLCYGDFDFAPGSTHIISATTPQSDITGKVWAFDSWDRGGGENTVYRTDFNTGTMDTITANFLPGGAVSLYTNPPGLPLTIDGRSNWPSPTFIWALGSTHTVTAQPKVTDFKGRKYNFKAWTNGGPATQQLSVDQSAISNGFRMTANYSILSRLVVQTSPPGFPVQVDGASCLSPCTIDRPSGSQIHVTAPSSVPVTDASRYDFASWSDNGASDHIVTLNSDFQALTASYQTMYRLAAASSPSGGATLQFSPSTPDLFFPSGQAVTVTAQSNPGFKFQRWTGDLSGTYPSGQVVMAQASSVVAQLNTIPYIAPAGIQNAAGGTPDAVVAPGSLIAISGASLTADTMTGPTNPLTQTLDGIVVTMGDRFFPLLSVSPTQVIAQLPVDLTDGNYNLTVSSTGQPDVTGTFTVARNAPGLFTWTTDSRPIALAFHQDGTPITPDSPAIQGETVTVYGTGFGPCQQPQFAGFLLQGAPPNALSDTLSISLGSAQPTPTFAGAATDKIGMQVARFQITSDLPSATTLQLTVTVNGRTSNTVQLPLQ